MSIFNPWVILGFVLSVLTAFGGGYTKGKHDENTRQQVEIARLNELARTKEVALASAVNTTANALRRSNAQAQVIAQQRSAAIDSGALKLRLPVKAACPVSTTADPTAASGDRVQAGAELDPATARSLVAITDQGDANTRQLNACIDAYNAVYQTLKGSP